MPRRKTHEEFVKEVYDLVGDEYTVLGTYVNSTTKIKIRHNSENCDYNEYDVKPSEFLNGSRCKKCSQRKTHEEFVKEVYDLVGDEYTVIGKYKTAHTKIEMRHNSDKCENHVFPVKPNNFLENGSRCPKCFGTHKKTTEQFKNEVKELVGDEYSVLGTYKSTNTEILMKHNNCGEKFDMTPKNFLRGHRCPKCFGKFKKTTEQFKKEVFELVGDKYQVLGEYIDGLTEILMRHNNESCNYHEFPMRPSAFLQGQRCPKCNESKGEKEISRILDKLNITYKEQYKFDDCRNKKPLPFDFAIFDKNNDLIALIEYQGEQHYKPIKHFGGEEHLTYVKNNDLIKKEYCKRNNIKLIEIPYWEFDNIETILQNFVDTHFNQQDCA